MGANATADSSRAGLGGRIRAFGRWAIQRPVLSIAVIGCVSAAYQIWWVSNHRNLGGLGVDESAYLHDAFRFHRALDEDGPRELASVVLGSRRNAPLVPLLAVPFIAAFGRSLTAALAVQAVLYLVCAVAVTAIVRRLASTAAALVAGLVALGLPVSIVSARSLQVSLAVSAFLCLSVLALVSSRRGHDPLRMLLAGCAVGAMVLSRTMAVAFIPGLMAGAFLLLDRNRRVATNVALAAVGSLLVAGPWWLRQFDDVAGYLVSFGYGSGATQISGVPFLLRPPVRLGLVMADVRPLLLVPALTIGIVAVRHRRRGPSTARAAPCVGARAIGVVVGLGFVALLSSSNLGSSFQMPLEVLAIAGVCVAGARLEGPPTKAAATLAVVAAVANVALISNWRPGSTVPVGGATLSLVAFGGTEDGQAIDFEAIDPRFASSAGWDRRAAAEGEWYELSVEIARAVEDMAEPGEPVLQSVFGENRLLRAPTLALTEELTGTGRGFAVDQPARPEAMADTGDLFAPTTGGAQRFLIVIRSPHYLVDDPADSARWVPDALENGWEVRRTLPMPDGGDALVLAHPASGTNR